MPLSQCQTFEGFGFGGFGSSGEYIAQSQCQKRKFEISERAQTEDIDGNCDLTNEHHESFPKRQCQWLSQESQNLNAHQNESHGGDVNMEEDRDISSSVRHINNNTSSDQTNSNCCPDDGQEALETSSMDADSVPVESHSVSRHTSSAVSTPRKIVKDRRCGFLSCRGLKPSPMSGRLYCHCSASWRGMYGLDTGYITDYY